MFTGIYNNAVGKCPGQLVKRIVVSAGQWKSRITHMFRKCDCIDKGTDARWPFVHLTHGILTYRNAAASCLMYLILYVEQALLH
jgi:hypothetical protein